MTPRHVAPRRPDTPPDSKVIPVATTAAEKAAQAKAQGIYDKVLTKAGEVRKARKGHEGKFEKGLADLVERKTRHHRKP